VQLIVKFIEISSKYFF